MNPANNNIILDSAPSVTLTVGELREVVRQEINAVLRQHDFRDIGKSSSVTNVAVKPYLNVREAAEFSRLAVSTVRLYIRKGILKSNKIGTRVIISRAELERFLANNSTKGHGS